MGFFTSAILLLLSCLAASSSSSSSNANAEDVVLDPHKVPEVNKVKDERVSYIVQLSDPSVIEKESDGRRRLDVSRRAVQQYIEYLETQQNQVVATIGGRTAQKFYSYKYTFNGFSIQLTAAEAQQMQKEPNVVKIYKDETRELLRTDNTADWIGLAGPGQPWSLGFTGENVVVAVMDTGIYPEHPSFADVPTPIRGNTGPLTPYGDFSGAKSCTFGNVDYNPNDAPFECNNKLVIAKCFAASKSSAPNASLPCGGDGSLLAKHEFLSARDADDHGTHVLSTAAGNYGVEAVGRNNETLGNITGMAPRAHLAAYKVCWEDKFGKAGCAGSDILAAIDQAVADGVDVINLSLGSPERNMDRPYGLALLRAADAGIHIATSAGNSGSDASTIGSPANLPWVTAVGAAIDNVPSAGAELEIISPASVVNKYFAIQASSTVLLGDVNDDDEMSGEIVPAEPLEACTTPLNNTLQGKIALVVRGGCTFSVKFNAVAAAGAKSIVVYNHGLSPESEAQDPIRMSAPNTTIPGLMISHEDGVLLYEAATTSGNQGAAIGEEADPLEGILRQISLENQIAVFSSRGPNSGAPDTIKPDIVVPGVSILAGLSPHSPFGNNGNTFGELDGTSMSSPHIAGIFALLKQAHPEWSAATAKSAIMTTARQDLVKRYGGDAADPFDMGSGHVVPQPAFEPGLVFDVDLASYESFLCGINDAISRVKCDELEGLGNSFDARKLNQPGIGIHKLAGTQTVTRTVTSVANTTETYTASVEDPPGFTITVNPSTISVPPGTSVSYDVTISSDTAAVNEWAFGSMTWSNGGGNYLRSSNNNMAYSVRSPIAVKTVLFDFPASVFGSGNSIGSPIGSLAFDVAFGFAGTYQAGEYGLVKATTQQGTTEQGTGKYDFQQDPEPGITRIIYRFSSGRTFARFALFDTSTSGEDDFDLYVWACPEGRDNINEKVCALAGASFSETSDETVDVAYPKEFFGAYSTYYIVDIHAFRTEASATNFTLFHWDVGSEDDDPQNMVVTAPTSAVLGTATFTVSWPGANALDAGERYLGAISHIGETGVLGLTTVQIDT